MSQLTTIKEIGQLKGHLGEPLGPSDWITITQEMINQFADVTGDRQWIHVDADRAKEESPFGQTVAHGYLTLSLIPLLLPKILDVQNASAVINYGIDKLRLPTPVPAEGRVRLKSEIKNVRDLQGGGARVTIAFEFELDGGVKSPCMGDVVYVYFP